MINVKTKIFIKDNSGLLVAKCINTRTNGRANNAAKVGHVVKVTITKAKSKASTLRKQETRKAANKQQNRDLSAKGSLQTLLLIQTKKPVIRYDGSSVKFNTNSALCVHLKAARGAATVTTKQHLVLGFKRINSCLPFELKNKVYWQAFGGTINLIKLAKSLI